MTWKHLKGGIIDRVEHPVTKRTGVVRLDKRTMWFYAREKDDDAMTEPFADKSGDKVRDWLLEQLKHTGAEDRLEWLPVIQIESGGAERHYYRDDSKEELSQSVKLEIKRYYIALTRDQREWRQLKWEQVDPKSSGCVEENDRFAVSRNYGSGPKNYSVTNGHEKAFKLPQFEERGYGDPKIVVAYTDELWAGLLMIVEQIKNARATISKLVSTKQGIATVGMVGAGKAPLMLTSGKGEK